MKKVGIIGKGGNPLYCHPLVRGGYRVINGDWELSADGMVRDGKNSTFIKYAIVLDNMDDMDYQNACALIEEAYTGNDDDYTWIGLTYEQYIEKIVKEKDQAINNLNTKTLMNCVNYDQYKTELREILLRLLIQDKTQKTAENILLELENQKRLPDCPKCGAKNSVESTWHNEKQCVECGEIISTTKELPF